MEDEKTMAKVDVALATCSREYTCQSYIFLGLSDCFMGNLKSIRYTRIMKSVPEEEFPVLETVAPK